MVLDRLGLLPDEWESLPWYHQQMFLEELGDQMEREEEKRRDELRALGVEFNEAPLPPPRPAPDAQPLASQSLRELGFKVVS